MKQIVICFCLFFCLFSCRKAQENALILDLGNAFSNECTILLDEISDGIQLIPLETKDDVLIGRISQIYQKDNYIFIIHGEDCSLFNLEGRHICNIGRRGNGPEEYLGIRTVFLEKDTFFIHDALKSQLMCYNLNGQFLKSSPVLQSIRSIVQILPDLYAGFVPNWSGQEVNQILYFDQNGEIVDSIPYSRSYSNPDNIMMGFGSDGGLYKMNNHCYYKDAFNDTLFILSPDRRLIPHHIFDLGAHKMNVEVRYSNIGRQDPQIAGKKTSYPMFENNRYLGITGWGFDRNRFVLLDKQTQELCNAILHYNEKEKNLLGKEDPVFFPYAISADSKMLISYEEPVHTEDDSNPTIVLVKLKERK